MKQDERDLLLAIHRADDASEGGDTPRESAERLRIPPKRAAYIFEKWSRHDLYDYGVADDLGWLTDAGRELAERERTR